MQNKNQKIDRAKLFQPFDSLKGFSSYIRNKEKIVIARKELCSDTLYELDWKIHQVKIGTMISIVYYDKNKYVFLEGMVAKLDLEQSKTITIVNKTIQLTDIVKISSHYFE